MLEIWNRNNTEVIIKLKPAHREKEYVKRFVDDAEALAKCLAVNLPDSTFVRLTQILLEAIQKGVGK